MGKSQSEKVFSASKASEGDSEVPPKIPPRMKKKGPTVPEKPPHMRGKPLSSQSSPSDKSEPKELVARVVPKHLLRELTNTPERHSPSSYERHSAEQRDILVAASKAGRERPVEKRQREPAKLLAPLSGSKTPPELRSQYQHHRPSESVNPSRQSKAKVQPVVLIPRSVLVDKRAAMLCAPVSYAVWMHRDPPPPPRLNAKPQLPVAPSNKPKDKLKSILTSATSGKTRSSSVTRSGSLTSQGSSSSDSGNETFPKSVLKKQKRNVAAAGGSLNPKSSQKLEHKKNVTFNAFATVQLMEE